MAIDRKARFTITSPDEIQVSEGISIPKNLEPIVANAPKDDQAAAKYLQDLVANQIITIDEVGFLLDSGAFE